MSYPQIYGGQKPPLATCIGGNQGSVSVCEVPPIPDAIDRQSKANSEIHNVISVLEGRLNPLLRPEPQNAVSPDQRDQIPTGVLISDKIRQNAQITERAIIRLNEILRLLEL